MNKIFVGLLSVAGVVAIGFSLNSSVGPSRIALLNYFDEDAYAEAQVEEILTAIQAQDAESIKNMFSDQARADADDLNSGVNYLFLLMNSEEIEWRFGGSWSESENHHGKKIISYHYHATISVTDNEYTLCTMGCIRDDYNSSNVGLTSISVHDATESDPDWNGVGIYIP